MKMIDYKYMKEYILKLDNIYRVSDVIDTLEFIECYIDYYPKCEYPNYLKQYDLNLKEVKKLLKQCDKRIRFLKRVGNRK